MAIKEFVDSFARSLGFMDIETLEPMSNFTFHPLFDKAWIGKIELTVNKIKNHNISMDEVAGSISGPSNLRAQLFFLLLDLKSSGTEMQKRKYLADFFEKILLVKAKKDHYGWKSNIVHSHKEISDMLKKKFLKGTPEIARLLGKLFSSSYHFANGLYTDFYTDYAVEYQGPYRLDKKRILIIKHFFDIRPLLLWPGIKSPCKKLSIYTIYKNVSFKCDAISCHSQYEGDIINGMDAYRVEADGKEINDLSKISALNDTISKLSVEQWKRLLSLNKEKLKIKGMEMRGYVLKEFFELAGIDWKPDKKLLSAVKNKNFAYKLWKPKKGKEKEYWKKMMDPDTEFYP